MRGRLLRVNSEIEYSRLARHRLKLKRGCSVVLVFINKSLLNSFLGHNMSERHVVNAQVKVVSVFRQVDCVLPQIKSVRKRPIEYLPFVDLHTVFVDPPSPA